MDQLIVDFPHRRAEAGGVRFAPEIEVSFCERHSEDTWHSSSDYRSFRAETKRHVQDAHRRALSSSKSQDWDEESILGIEHLLSPSLIRKSRASRTLCWRAVLNEQDRQDEAGECNPERLASVARQCTQWSTRRAHTIGLLQSR